MTVIAESQRPENTYKAMSGQIRTKRETGDGRKGRRVSSSKYLSV